jgi:hypothetical protein
MNQAILMDAEKLSEIQRSVRDRFSEGGSFVSVVLVIIGLIGLVLVTYLLTVRQSKQAGKTTQSDPGQLFRDLGTKLNLMPEQVRFLDEVATNAGLRHPAVIFLSRARYDECVVAYCASPPTSDIDPDDASAMASSIRVLLFPVA